MGPERSITVRAASSPRDLERCFAVRREVFGRGQGVAEAEDFDGRDPACGHLLAQDPQGCPVGTARLRITEQGAPKAERVAVVEAWRGRAVGRALMEALEDRARGLGHGVLQLNAQLEVIPFYEALGYRAHGPVFFEAGIPHRRMERPL
jgi:predicted GNAT family N-acyltransferase